MERAVLARQLFSGDLSGGETSGVFVSGELLLSGSFSWVEGLC